MTVIFSTGEFWIEFIVGQITTLAAAGGYLEIGGTDIKGGRYVGGSMIVGGGVASDLLEAIGALRLVNQIGVIPAYGTVLTNVRVQLFKSATVGGEVIPIQAVIFLRK